MNFKEKLKKTWFSITNKHRLILLDYPVFPKRLYTEESKHPHAGLYQLINKERANYKNTLLPALKYRENILSIQQDKDVKNNIDPGWNNGYLPGLDIIM